MADIENFIDAMMNKDHVQSSNIFAELMNQKVDAALDAEKVAMAGQIFNDVEEIDDEEIDDEDISDEDLEAAADEAIDDEDLEMYDPEDYEAEEGETVDISSEEELELEDETV